MPGINAWRDVTHPPIAPGRPHPARNRQFAAFPPITVDDFSLHQQVLARDHTTLSRFYSYPRTAPLPPNECFSLCTVILLALFTLSEVAKGRRKGAEFARLCCSRGACGHATACPRVEGQGFSPAINDGAKRLPLRCLSRSI